MAMVADVDSASAPYQAFSRTTCLMSSPARTCIKNLAEARPFKLEAPHPTNHPRLTGFDEMLLDER